MAVANDSVLDGTQVLVSAAYVAVPAVGTASSVALPLIADDAEVVIATKGIEEESLKLMTGVLGEVAPQIGPERVGVVSGPSFAKEVVRDLPTDVVVASTALVHFVVAVPPPVVVASNILATAVVSPSW